MSNETIIINGAGLSGPLLAILLKQKGYNVSVYERRSDMRKTTVSAGRSINLALSARGIKALQQIGMAEHVLKDAVPMPGRLIHDSKRNTNFQP